ncbi:MAG: hypothetical protein WCW44_05375 [archaeon]|jgi:hypothetical protein
MRASLKRAKLKNVPSKFARYLKRGHNARFSILRLYQKVALEMKKGELSQSTKRAIDIVKSLKASPDKEVARAIRSEIASAKRAIREGKVEQAMKVK